MDEVKGKVKDFMKKINNPFASSSSSSSGKFKGQGRVLGSSSSSSSNQKPTSTIQRPQQSVAPAPSSGSKGIITKQNNTGNSKEPIEKDLSESLSLNQSEPKIRDGVDPFNSKADVFDPFDTLVSSTRGPKSGTSLDMFQCPVCSEWFNSENEVSAHVENCLENNPTDEAEKNPSEGKSEARNELVNQVGIFVSGNPSNATFEILLKLLRNIINDPRNEKFRRIRMSNPKIQETVGMAVGGVELLEAIGFKFQAEGEHVWGVMEMPSTEGLSVITHAIALLEPHVLSPISSSSVSSDRQKSGSAEPKKIDRQVRVFFAAPESMAARIELPDSFYDLSAAEARREAESRKKKIEDSQLLIPKSLKEKQAKSARKRYKATVIRIQFPDGVILQGVFLPQEQTTALYEFVGSALKEGSLEFELLTPALPKRRVIPRFAKPGERMPTLDDEDLVPTALIKFKPIETDSIVFTGLSSNLLEISEPLTSEAFPSGGGFVPGL